jgi:hypothetical protein
MIIYYQSDNILKLTGLKNLATGAYINNATVNCYIDPRWGRAGGRTILAYTSGLCERFKRRVFLRID